MFNTKKLDEIAKQVSDALPEGLKNVGGEIDKKIRNILEAQIQKLNVVSREEFEIQTKVLMKTREKLEEMEKKITELENAQTENTSHN